MRGKTFIIRVEQQNRSMWRAVKRQVTPRGVSADRMQIIGDNYPRRNDAETVAQQAKNKLRREQQRQPAGAG